MRIPDTRPEPSIAEEMLMLAINNGAVQYEFKNILKDIEAQSKNGNTEIRINNPKSATISLLKSNGFKVEHDTVYTTMVEMWYKVKWS